MGGGQNPPLSEDDPEYKVFFLAQLPKCWDYSAPPHVVSGAGDGAQGLCLRGQRFAEPQPESGACVTDCCCSLLRRWTEGCLQKRGWLTPMMADQ